MLAAKLFKLDNLVIETIERISIVEVQNCEDLGLEI